MRVPGNAQGSYQANTTGGQQNTVQEHLAWINTGIAEHFRQSERSSGPPSCEWARRVDYVPNDVKFTRDFMGDYYAQAARVTPGDVAIGYRPHDDSIHVFVYLMNDIWYEIPDMHIVKKGIWGASLASPIRSWVALRRIDRIVTAASMGRIELAEACDTIPADNNTEHVRFRVAITQLEEVIAAVGGEIAAANSMTSESVRRSFQIWQELAIDKLTLLDANNPTETVTDIVRDALGLQTATPELQITGFDALVSAIRSVWQLEDTLLAGNEINLMDVEVTLRTVSTLAGAIKNTAQQLRRSTNSSDPTSAYTRIIAQRDQGLLATLANLAHSLETFREDAGPPPQQAPPQQAPPAGQVQRRRRRINIRDDEHDD
jgi:hypothetical protein